MERKIKIVKLPQGTYVQDWQYSQGNFEVVQTPDIFNAIDFTGKEHGFKTFFRDIGAQMLDVTFTAKIN